MVKKPKTLNEEIAIVISKHTIFGVVPIQAAHDWLGSWDAVLYAIDFATRTGAGLVTAVDCMRKVQQQ